MRYRLGATIAVALCAFGITAQAASATPCVTALSCGVGLNAMLDLEAKIPDQTHAGYVTEVDFATPDQVPGQVVSHSAYYDAGLWTGVYGAGEAFRYATAKRWLATLLSPADQAFWQAQKSEALARVRSIVDMYDRNVNIAASYTGQLKIPPSVALTDPTHLIDPGQIITGEKGMLMRSCTVVGDPLGMVNADSDAQVGPLHWKDGKDYTCLDNTSRDTYAGTIYGLLTIFDLVSGDDLAMRHRIRDYLYSIASELLKYGWFMPHPWNNQSIGTEFIDFFFPLFIYSPGPQLNVLEAAAHAADVDGTLLDKIKWDTLETAEAVALGPIVATTGEVDALDFNAHYFKWNLGHLVDFDLMRLMPPIQRAFVAHDVSNMEATVGDDLNAHFEAIVYSMTGDSAKRDAAIAHLLQWLDYRQNTSGGAVVYNSARCNTFEIHCVPEDHVELSYDGGVHRTVLTPGTSSMGRSFTPLPIAWRTPTDFLWQRSPHQLDGQQAATHRTPAIDYLSPYWMLRYYTEVAPPAVRPLPPSLFPGSY